MNKKAQEVGSDGMLILFVLFIFLFLVWGGYMIMTKYFEFIISPLMMSIILIIVLIIFIEITFYFVVKSWCDHTDNNSDIMLIKLISFLIALVITFLTTMASWVIMRIVLGRRQIFNTATQITINIWNSIIHFFTSRNFIIFLCILLGIIFIVGWMVLNIKLAKKYWISKPPPPLPKKKKKRKKEDDENR